MQKLRLRLTESTWRVAEGSYFTFCSSVLSPEGKDQVGRKRKQSVHRREVLQSSTMSTNDPEHDDAEGWCKTVMNYTKTGFEELGALKGFIFKKLDLGLLDSSLLACFKN
ncbi:hypothetical protein MTR67_017901 [Solanum verrucosum]|uniref:Uncharacterized protein n=1 Tax=Solanum verrucosum TaxID=315347 RepID=A0AAF0TLY5_SOLVR|nr:hypothetical protein MTR67_017901 [Solanum verrucosum]